MDDRSSRRERGASSPLAFVSDVPVSARCMSQLAAPAPAHRRLATSTCLTSPPRRRLRRAATVVFASAPGDNANHAAHNGTDESGRRSRRSATELGFRESADSSGSSEPPKEVFRGPESVMGVTLAGFAIVFDVFRSAANVLTGSTSSRAKRGARVRELERQQQRLSAEKAQLQRELTERSAAAVAGSSGQRQAESAELSEARQKIAELQSRVRAAEERVFDDTSRLSVVELARESAEQKAVALERSLEELRHAHERQGEKLGEIGAERDRLRQLETASYEQHRVQLAREQRTASAALGDERDALKASAEALQRQLEQLREERDALRADADAAGREAGKLSAACDSRKRELAELQRRFDELMSDKQVESEKNVRLNEMIHRLEEIAEQKAAEHAQLLAEVERERQDNKTRVDSAQRAKVQREKEAGEASRQLRQLERQLSDVTLQNDAALDNAARENAEMERVWRAADGERVELERELSSLRRSAANAEEVRRREDVVARESIGRLSEELEELRRGTAAPGDDDEKQSGRLLEVERRLEREGAQALRAALAETLAERRLLRRRRASAAAAERRDDDVEPVDDAEKARRVGEELQQVNDAVEQLSRALQLHRSRSSADGDAHAGGDGEGGGGERNWDELRAALSVARGRLSTDNGAAAVGGGDAAAPREEAASKRSRSVLDEIIDHVDAERLYLSAEVRRAAALVEAYENGHADDSSPPPAAAEPPPHAWKAERSERVLLTVREEVSRRLEEAQAALMKAEATLKAEEQRLKLRGDAVDEVVSSIAAEEGILGRQLLDTELFDTSSSGVADGGERAEPRKKRTARRRSPASSGKTTTTKRGTSTRRRRPSANDAGDGAEAGSEPDPTPSSKPSSEPSPKPAKRRGRPRKNP